MVFCHGGPSKLMCSCVCSHIHGQVCVTGRGNTIWVLSCEAQPSHLINSRCWITRVCCPVEALARLLDEKSPSPLLHPPVHRALMEHWLSFFTLKNHRTFPQEFQSSGLRLCMLSSVSNLGNWNDGIGTQHMLLEFGNHVLFSVFSTLSKALCPLTEYKQYRN